jgi:hypothetical protein
LYGERYSRCRIRPASFVVQVRGRKPHDEEVSTMAATIDIEVESGVYTDPIRRHRGYWAGDFSAHPRMGESD